MATTRRDGVKSMVGVVAITLGACLCWSSVALAADRGELCGRARGWSKGCAAGLYCDIRWRLGPVQIGLCTEEERSCGGLAGAACEPDEYCDYAAAALCGAADQTGVCRPRPNACTKEYQPVCGCDDRTYGNRCAANAAGVSVAAQGPCESEAECTTDDECPHGACQDALCTACGDGSELSCDAVPSPCLVAGEVHPIVGGCYGGCVDRHSCQPTHCELDGYVYPNGSNFFSRGTCHPCTCGHGSIACATVQCVCQGDPRVTLVSRSVEECNTLEFSCPEGWDRFGWFCGCGCVSRDYVLETPE